MKQQSRITKVKEKVFGKRPRCRWPVSYYIMAVLSYRFKSNLK